MLYKHTRMYICTRGTFINKLLHFVAHNLFNIVLLISIEELFIKSIGTWTLEPRNICTFVCLLTLYANFKKLSIFSMSYKMYRLSSDIAWPCTDCTVLLLFIPCVRVCVYYRGRVLRERRRVTIQFYASDNAPQVFEYRPWLWEPKQQQQQQHSEQKQTY